MDTTVVLLCHTVLADSSSSSCCCLIGLQDPIPLAIYARNDDPQNVLSGWVHLAGETLADSLFVNRPPGSHLLSPDAPTRIFRM